MKKTILSLSFMIILGLGTTYASDDSGVNVQTMQSFHKSFGSAKDVNWQKEKDYNKATFRLNDQYLTAYYNENAELVAIVRNVLADHLPILLLTDLQNNYEDYWITELYEVAAAGESFHRITIENADQILIMRSVNATDWVVEKKVKKT